MAKVKLHKRFKSLHGRMGNIIYYNVYGIQYARSFTIPRNPRTKMQQVNRKAFAKAVKLWQKLPSEEKALYNIMAVGKPLTGYNIFISFNMKGISHEIIMQLYRASLSAGILPAGCPKADTSVSGSQNHVNGPVYLFKEKLILNKPPGTEAAAA